MTSRNAGRNGRVWRRVRAQVLAESDTCWLCQQPGADSVDHVVPLALGGAPHDPRNLRPAHLTCNMRRGTGHRAGQAQPASRRW